MKGKLIVIEGTASSGKQTQAKLLTERLNSIGLTSEIKSFPDYESPTGQIIEKCILGKNTPSLFNEGVNNIPPKVAALYYAADRAYNIDRIKSLLDKGINIILDRYVESNMAYQAAKFTTDYDQINTLLWMEQLEFNLLDLPRPNKVIFLYLPYQYRDNKNEYDDHAKNIEKVYSLMAERYNFEIINCIKEDKIRTKEDINEEIFVLIKNYLSNN